MSKRILIVDDEPNIREVTQMSLEMVGGHQVLEASSGAEAIEIAAREKPDAILLDVMMPEMDGPTTLQALRRLPGLESTPVIFITAKVQAQEIAGYRDFGALDVIAKPFDPMTLAAQVEAIWQRSKGV